MYSTAILLIYLCIVLVMSLAAIVLYGKDKKMSKGGTEVRIKEKTLLSVAVYGGALGAFIGRLMFHHKTNKIYFSITILTSLLLQAAVLVLLMLNAGGILA